MSSYTFTLRRQSATQVGTRYVIVSRGLSGPQGPQGDPGSGIELLTAKGDLLGHDGASGVRVPAGANGHVLTADSSQTPGLKWAAPDVTQAELDAVAAAAAADVDAHEADTTGVHGIADTSALYRAGGTDVAVADGGTGASSASGARTNLGLVIGTDVQAQSATLALIAALSTTAYGRALLEVAGQAALTALIAAASETATGAVELATTAEVVAGTDTARAVTPAGVKAVADLKLSLAANGSSVENIGAVESNVNTVASSGSTETLDTSVYGVHDVTMSENCTFTFSNPAPSGKCTIFTLVLRGAFTPTWPAAVDWPDATQPTYGTPTVYTFMTVDAGATWLGASAGKAFG